jgi:hypothetical protein
VFGPLIASGSIVELHPPLAANAAFGPTRDIGIRSAAATVMVFIETSLTCVGQKDWLDGPLVVRLSGSTVY